MEVPHQPTPEDGSTSTSDGSQWLPQCHKPRCGVGESNMVSGFCSLFSQNRSAFVASDSLRPRGLPHAGSSVFRYLLEFAQIHVHGGSNRIPKVFYLGKKGSEAQDWKPLLPRGLKSFTGDFGSRAKTVSPSPRARRHAHCGPGLWALCRALVLTKDHASLSSHFCSLWRRVRRAFQALHGPRPGSRNRRPHL